MMTTKPLYTALFSLSLLAACGGSDDDDSSNTTTTTTQACAIQCWRGCNSVSSCNVGASCDSACDDGDAACRGVCYNGLSSQDQERFDEAFACASSCYPANSCEACLSDCVADADCRLLATCLSTCGDEDSDCEAACMQTYPDGVSLATRAKQCGQDRGCE